MEEKKIGSEKSVENTHEKGVGSKEIVITHDSSIKKEEITGHIVRIPMIKDELEIRKDKFISFLNQKKNWFIYLILAIIVYVGVYVRTRNIPLLKDITTNTWTLGPDLDPFLFLRWAKEIVANGSLAVIDHMRYVPIGYNTAGEMKLLSYMIAWFYKGWAVISHEVTITYAAIIFPAFMFGITTIAFFLFARKMFYQKTKKIRNIIALIATAFFILIPSLLPRTIAGIPEKESVAFFFMFMTFYLFLEAITTNKLKKGIIFGVLAGMSTAMMALVWGGVLFVFFSIPFAILFAFIFGKLNKEKIVIYGVWVITSFVIMNSFSTRYAIKNMIMSSSTGSALGVFVILILSLFVIKSKIKNNIIKKINISNELFAVIFSALVIFVLMVLVFGPKFILDQGMEIKSSLITPMTTRFGLTVAENKQPYFVNDWKSSFGPVFHNIPLFFWLFFIGSIMLFNNLIAKLRKNERIILTTAYLIFLICLIFSRYSGGSVLNGTSALSLLVYFGGWMLFLGSFTYFYFRIYSEGRFSVFSEFELSYLLYFITLTLGIIGARGGIRLIMVLGAVSPIAVAYLIVNTSQRYFKKNNSDLTRLFLGISAILIILASLFTAWNYYQQDKGSAENFGPGMYQWQWQKAMDWVRTNTSEDSVFAHWWDYGYWLQSIGERATMLDGGNSIGYWNHLMGRHVLTGTNEQEALNVLYSHNVTHLLIDSTELGKYTAYSSIGSDENYDRFSWFGFYLIDEKQTQETKNETILVYTGGTSIDEDITWDQNGTKVFLPKKKAALGAIIIRKQGDKITQPEAVFIYGGIQYRIPLRYAFIGKELKDFGSGLDAGVFIFPKVSIGSNNKVEINSLGAMAYLSKRTIHSGIARLYLFDQNSDYFKLVHTEDNMIVKNMKDQGANIGSFVYFNDFLGPIKIWEVSYPNNMEVNPEYLLTDFPNPEVNKIKLGEY